MFTPEPSAGGSHVVLVGQMGVGKSTMGESLARVLGRDHADCDEDLYEVVGCTSAEYVAEFGLPALHEVEAGVLLERLAGDRALVISAAASVVDSAVCRDALAHRAVVVWIDDPPLEVAARGRLGSHRRPLSEADALALDARRRPRYAEVADVVVSSTTPVDEVIAAVEGRRG